MEVAVSAKPKVPLNKIPRLYKITRLLNPQAGNRKAEMGERKKVWRGENLLSFVIVNNTLTNFYRLFSHPFYIEANRECDCLYFALLYAMMVRNQRQVLTSKMVKSANNWIWG